MRRLDFNSTQPVDLKEKKGVAQVELNVIGDAFEARGILSSILSSNMAFNSSN